MGEELIPDNWTEKNNIIKVIGVGGGGTNAVTYMYEQKIEHIDYVVCNTDAQHLATSPVPHKLQLGGVITKGLGAGTDALTGKKAAVESLEDINNCLAGTNEMVFITCGMGGGTGTGAAPIIAEAAKNKGLLTVGVVTIPFRDEGPNTLYRAIEGIKEYNRQVDTLIIIDNQKLYDVYPGLEFFDALDKANEVLATAVKSITEIITCRGVINMDFNDVKKILKDSGMAFMGIGRASGSDRARQAIENALNSPLMYNCDVTKSNKVLVNISTSNIKAEELQLIMDYIAEKTGGANNFKRGIVRDPSMGDEIAVTIVATGYNMTDLPHVDLDTVNKDNVIMVDVSPDDPSLRKTGLPLNSGDIISITKKERYAGKPALITNSPDEIQTMENESAFRRRDRMLHKQRKEQFLQNQEIQSEDK